MDEDYLLAIQLQEQFDFEASQTTQSHDGDGSGQSNKKRKLESDNRAVIPYTRPPVHPERPMSIVDESWETLDPSPDARAMFLEFNDMFFWGKLSGVEVKWSPRMTLCAGVCSYEGRGGLCSIRLSEPLLKLRPRRDLVQTLLHEMIHALLFVTQNNRDRDGHGPEFCKHMNRINDASGTKITVYHTFHDEVDLYRQHWWRCNGPCQSRKPYFGYVKRAMNRAPSALDPWWGHHQSTCGGTYTKVKEPEGYGKKGKAQKDGGKDKTNAAKKPAAKPGTLGTTAGSQDIRNIIPFSGKGFLLGGSSQASSSSSSSAHRPPDRNHTPPPVCPVSPPKAVLSPLGQTTNTVRSPGRPGESSHGKYSSSSTTRPTAGGAHVTPPGPRAPTKKSVSNTRVFTNINGSPVRIPKHSSQSTKLTDILKTKQSSVQDLFNARGLRTSQSTASSSTVSKPPAETKSATTLLSAGGSNSFRQPRNTTSTTSANHTTGITAAASSSSSSSSPLSRPGAISGIGSKPSSAKPYHPQPSFNPASQPGLSSSRKRPWENRTSAHIFDFFQRTLQEASATSSTPSTSTTFSSSSREERGAATAAAAAVDSSPSPSSPAAQLSTGASASLMVSCPVCQAKMQEAMINEHLDSCLSG